MYSSDSQPVDASVFSIVIMICLIGFGNQFNYRCLYGHMKLVIVLCNNLMIVVEHGSWKSCGWVFCNR